MKILNNIVSGYFDFAEIQDMRHNPMYMSDYVEHLDNILQTTGEKDMLPYWFSQICKKSNMKSIPPILPWRADPGQGIKST